MVVQVVFFGHPMGVLLRWWYNDYNLTKRNHLLHFWPFFHLLIAPLRFQDISVPLAGIPVELNRLYDSTNKCPGDFGYGWRLAQPDVQVNITMGLFWELDKQYFCVPPSGNPKYPPYTVCNGVELPYYCIQDSFAHYVSVTMPDGKTETWDVSLDPVGSAERVCVEVTPPRGMKLVFTPRPGTTSELKVAGQNVWYYAPFTRDDNTVDYLLVNNDFQVMDPDLFSLTTADNVEFLIHKREGLQSIRDLEGNRVDYGFWGIMHSSGVGIRFERDEARRIIRATDPEGNTVHYGYDEKGDLVTVTDREGHTIQYVYDEHHNLIAVIDPNGDIPAKFKYNDSGRLIGQEDAYGNQISYDYDIPGRQEQITDRNGNAHVYVFDQYGNQRQYTDPLGLTKIMEYDQNDNLIETEYLHNGLFLKRNSKRFDSNNRLNEETDALGRISAYVYNENGDPRVIIKNDLKMIEFFYDESGNITRIENAAGSTTYFTKDVDPVQRKVVSTRTTPDGYVETTEWNYRGDVQSHVKEDLNIRFRRNANGQVLDEIHVRQAEDGGTYEVVKSFVYDKNGKILEATEFDGARTLFEYDSLGNLIKKIWPGGQEELFEYSFDGQLVRHEQPSGLVTINTYDSEGNKTSETRPNGAVYRMEHDANRQLRKRIQPDGSEMRQDFDALGNLSQSFDYNGNKTEFEYDDVGRVERVTDALGQVTRYFYNLDDTLVEMVDPRGFVTTEEYDDYRRLVRIVYPDGTDQVFTHDGNNRVDSVRAQSGAVFSYEFGPHGNLSSVTDPLGRTTTYTYNETFGKTMQVDALGRNTSRKYDDLGRNVSTILPLGFSDYTDYNQEGKIDSYTDFNGDKTDFVYSPSGLLITKVYQNGSADHFAYDFADRLNRTDNTHGSTSYTYDLLDRLKEVTFPNGLTVAYDYDAMGNKTSIRTTRSEIRYEHDLLNRVDRVIDSVLGISDYEYDENGNVTRINYGNGMAAVWEYDAMNRATAAYLLNPDGTELRRRILEYLPSGNLDLVTHENGLVIDFDYDLMGQLIRESYIQNGSMETTFNYGYDAVGNLSHIIHNDEREDYSYDANGRLVQLGDLVLRYDANGNNVERENNEGLTVFNYDSSNRIVAYSGPDGSGSRQYSPEGHLLRSVRDGIATDHVYDVVGLVPTLLETHAETEISKRYVHGDRVLGVVGNETVTWAEVDERYNLVSLLDDQRATLTRYQYNAWGEHRVEGDSSLSDLLYGSQYHDRGLNMTYLNARHYDQTLKRFGARDPWHGDEQMPLSLNKYAYAHNNPVMLHDPTGLYAASISDFGASMSIAGTLSAISSATIATYKITAVTVTAVATGYLATEALSTIILAQTTKQKGKALMMTHFLLFTQSPEFKRGGKHRLDIEGKSHPTTRTKKILINKRQVGKLLVSRYKGGLPGRIFQYTYRIGQGNLGQGFFQFRLDYMDYTGPQPVPNIHYHLKYGSTVIDHEPL